ncbi:MAG: VIT domain-containing protein [Anaerolineae bacterium]
MFNPSAYDNSRPDGFSVLEVVATAEQEEQPRLFVPLKHTHLSGIVAGPLASLQLTQVFAYTREQCDKVLEAVYRFPLPGDAAVRTVRVRFGEVEIEATLKERRKAEQEYEQAKKEGRQAALATRESPDVFTLHVAGIQPDQDVTVETAYVQLARSEGSGWSLRLPLTTSPRYVRSDEVQSRHAQGQPLLLLRDPGHRFSLDLTILGASQVRSRTHSLAPVEEGEAVHVRLQEGEVLPDRDCVLTWQPRQERESPALQVFLGPAEAEGERYFLALVAPPTEQVAPPSQEAIVLVDHSGSMGGAKWEAADWAVKKFLLGLDEGSFFNLGLFHNITKWFAGAPQSAGAKTVEKALAFLGDKDSGGTELGVALEQALGQKRSRDAASRHVFIITDAEVSDEGRILRLAEEESARKERRRISVLCIDAAPNSHLANELAERGGGVARFLTSAPEEEDITTALDAILEDWAQPLLPNLRLEVSHGAVQAAWRAVLPGSAPGWSGIDLGDLPRGRTLWVAGRVLAAPAQAPSFRLADGNGQVIATSSGQEATGELAPALKALFGVRRVTALEYLVSRGYDVEALGQQLQRLGYDAEKVLAGLEDKVYAENRAAAAGKALHELLVREALYYGIASAETAFVAVRKEAGKPVEGTVPVANALPQGWSADFLSPAPGVRMARAAFAPPSQADTGVALAQPGPVTFAGTGLGGGIAKLMSLSPARVQPEATPVAAAKPQLLFSGVPSFTNSEALLFDSAQQPDAMPAGAIIKRLIVRFPDGMSASLDAGLAILIFLGDLSQPRARVRLADLLRQGGERPLNLKRAGSEPLRLVLEDSSGTWSQGAPRIEVSLGL